MDSQGREVTIQELFAIIGEQTLQIRFLQQKLAELQQKMNGEVKDVIVDETLESSPEYNKLKR